MGRGRWVLAIVSILGSYQATAETRIITFKEAISIALERNSSVRQAQNAAALSDIAVSEARNQFLPDLRFSTSGSQSYGRNFSETEGSIINQTSNSVNLGVSSGVTLFDGMRNTSNLRGAKFSRDASKLDLTRTRETAVFTVASNFLALIQQREQLRVQRERLTAESALGEQIKTYVDAGARTLADLYQQQATVANARLSVVQTENAVQKAEVDLIQTLQLDPRGTYEFQPPTPESITAATANPSSPSLPSPANAGEGQGGGSAPLPDLNALLDRAFKQRRDLDAEKARVAAAEQQARSARGGRWPSVSLSAGYNSGYTDTSALSFNDQLDLRRGGSVSLGVSIPIFDRNAVRNATSRAELQEQNARIALENAQQDVGVQVRTALQDYRTAREQLSAAEAQQRAAEQALQATQQRYQAGAATLVELSQSRATFVQAASALVTARYSLLFQQTLMDYYVGDLDPIQLANPNTPPAQ